MPHLVIKQRYQQTLNTDVVSVVGDLPELTFNSLNEKLKHVPRPQGMPVGSFERTAKDEWNWLVATKGTLERGLILVFGELEALGWSLNTSFVTANDQSKANEVVYIFKK
eukprot:TRINITY_DN10946_c0_g1_i1.p1 TRINITY_DN10946_c0_g1~~TRINITY_DN10946_c0_g1_i1.p1  ORF type:complete len:110 (-),score=21.53 TRINITY_DN10946_c0_g1_i1:111-440(-)